MRDILTGFAILLIIVLTTALVAPYFVDWNGQRTFLEKRLGDALGQRVTVGGNIDLKILPTPYLVLDQVVVGGDDGPVRLGVHHLDLELSVAPLLHGAFDIVEARLDEPTLRINLEHDRKIPILPTAPAFTADVRFDRIRVTQGTLAVADSLSGRTFVFDHLDFDAEAESLAGPFKVRGTQGDTGNATKFHLATSTPDRGRAHAHLVIDETPAHAGLDLDGTIALSEPAAPHGQTAAGQSFEGTGTIAGHIGAGADTPVAWRVTGPFKADPQRASLDEGELRLGTEDAGLTLQASANASLGDRPKLALAISAKQLDFDRLSGAPSDVAKPPPALPDLASLRETLGARPPIATMIDLSIANATYGADTLSDLQAHIDLDTDGARPLKFSGDGPGGSHVALDGMLDTSRAPKYVGTVDLEADNLPRTLGWIAGIAPDLGWKAADLPAKRVRIAGHLSATPAAWTFDNLTLGFDRSTLKGSGRIDPGAAGRPTQISAALTSDRLDLDGSPSLDAIARTTAPLDLDLQFDTAALSIAGDQDRAFQAGRIRLALRKTGSAVTLRTFHADDLGGASISATGHLDKDGGSLSLHVDAARLDATAALVRQFAPGPVADALVARAPMLAPAKLDVRIGLRPGADGARPVPSSFEVKGALATSRLSATTKSEPGGGDSIEAILDTDDGGALLRQIGLSTLPADLVGAGHVALRAHGALGTPMDTNLAATFGETTLEAAGRFDLVSSTPEGAGILHLRSADLTPILQSLALAFPDIATHMPVDLKGGFVADSTGATIDDLAGSVAGVGARGAIHFRQATGDQPKLTGSLDVDSLSLATLFGLTLGPPQPASGDARWSSAPFADGLTDPPRANLRVTAKTLELLPGLVANHARFELRLGPNLVSVAKAAADLKGGHIDGDVTLRRDGHQAIVESKLAVANLPIETSALAGRLSGRLDLSGGGTSALGLVSSLAGGGSATFADLRLPHGDPAALRKVFQDVEADTLAVDQEAIIRAYDDAAQAPLHAGTRHFDLALAAAHLRLDPEPAPARDDGAVASRIEGDFDIARSRLTTNVTQTLNALPSNWSGAPPTIAVRTAGPLDRPTRSVDVSGFINAVAARALARETARIEAYEADIRERAFFDARLASERRREEDRQKAADEARKAAAKAEAERKARLEAARVEAARQERLRKEIAARAAAREKAAQDAKAAHERQSKPDEAKPAENRARETAPGDRGAGETGAGETQPDGILREPRERRTGPSEPAPPADTQPTGPSVSDPSTLGRY